MVPLFLAPGSLPLTFHLISQAMHGRPEALLLSDSDSASGCLVSISFSAVFPAMPTHIHTLSALEFAGSLEPKGSSFSPEYPFPGLSVSCLAGVPAQAPQLLCSALSSVCVSVRSNSPCSVSQFPSLLLLHQTHSGAGPVHHHCIHQPRAGFMLLSALRPCGSPALLFLTTHTLAGIPSFVSCRRPCDAPWAFPRDGLHLLRWCAWGIPRAGGFTEVQGLGFQHQR